MTEQTLHVIPWTNKVQTICGALSVIALFWTLYYTVKEKPDVVKLHEDINAIRDEIRQLPEIEQKVNQIGEGSTQIGQRLSLLEQKYGAGSDVAVFNRYVETLKQQFPTQQGVLDKYVAEVETWRNTRLGAADALPGADRRLGHSPLLGGSAPPETGRSRPAAPDFLSDPQQDLLNALAAASKPPLVLGELSQPLEAFHPLDIHVGHDKAKTPIERAWDFILGYRGVYLLLAAALLLNLISRR